MVSTHNWHTQGLLAQGRGNLFGLKDAGQLAGVLCELLADETSKDVMRKRAYRYGRAMIWSKVAREYLALFDKVVLEQGRSPRPQSVGAQQRIQLDRLNNLPQFNPRHLAALTDDTGILQHARYGVPDRQHGYSADDQARALIVAVKASRLAPEAGGW